MDCRCQSATITTCALVEQSAGRQTLSGYIRKTYRPLSMDHVSIIHDGINQSLFDAAFCHLRGLKFEKKLWTDSTNRSLRKYFIDARHKFWLQGGYRRLNSHEILELRFQRHSEAHWLRNLLLAGTIELCSYFNVAVHIVYICLSSVLGLVL